MLKYLYSLVGYTLNIALRIAACRNDKAKEIILGRQQTLSRLKAALDATRPTIWFHVASLGEFEQGRPLIECIKSKFPEWQVVLSFYSPSGYRIRQDYKQADAVVYLLGDTPREVKSFLDTCKPDRAVFVKYDFWPVMLCELKRRNIATYLVSAIFREQQLFFKPWGGAYRHLLKSFEHLFVQDDNSRCLLHSIGIQNVSISGDTRFDRVESIAQAALDIPELRALKKPQQLTLVAGSTWGIDEEMLMQYSLQNPLLAIIYAPHELCELRMQALEELHGSSIARLSTVLRGDKKVEDIQHLIIDSFGLLSSLYRYADIAYIGGGFGKSIHNTIEAAVYGIPVLFGPKHEKFREAKLLVACGGGYSVESSSSFAALMEKLTQDDSLRASSGRAARSLITSQLGATEQIMTHLFS